VESGASLCDTSLFAMSPSQHEVDVARDELNESTAISDSSPSLSCVAEDEATQCPMEVSPPRVAPGVLAAPEAIWQVAMSGNTFQALRAMALRDTCQLDDHLGEVAIRTGGVVCIPGVMRAHDS
jgi:hypothetical protein